MSIIHNTEQRGKKSDDLSDFSDLTHDTNEIICRIKMAALWAFGTNIVFKRLGFVVCEVHLPRSVVRVGILATCSETEEGEKIKNWISLSSLPVF